jgi:5'/3'-nucleotidase
MGNRVPLILLSNDDGITSPGLRALEASLNEIGEIFVVAPDRERNASAHSITLARPLYVKQIESNRFSVTGTPTDCVNLAIHKVLPRRPDLVITGINKGGNLAEDVTYSGTVAGALEARLLGMDSFAISLVSHVHFFFESAALVSVHLAQWVLSYGLPTGVFLNVNVPNRTPDDLGPMKLTRLGKKVYGDFLEQCLDENGGPCFRFGKDANDFLEEDIQAEETDWKAVENGFVSVTPLRVNMTDEATLDVMKMQWGSGEIPLGETRVRQGKKTDG